MRLPRSSAFSVAVTWSAGEKRHGVVSTYCSGAPTWAAMHPACSGLRKRQTSRDPIATTL